MLGHFRPFWLGLALLLPAAQASSHPHVFMDGGVNFVLGNGHVLEALEVTWLYDEFETLYMLSSYGLSLNEQGDLDEADRQALIRHRSDWPEDFDGSAHLSLDGQQVNLNFPTQLDLHMRDGRLEVTFRRDLSQPTTLEGKEAEVAFYESTYFFAFKITQPPGLIGAAQDCTADVIPFNMDTELKTLQTTLLALGREETPPTENVGALFADRIVVQCG